MRFVDEAHIRVRAGCGGNGVVHFRREKYVPQGGPDGGDGGRGGDGILVGDGSLATLVDFHYRPHYQAEFGGDGRGQQRTGHSGAPCKIPVPIGTQVFNEETGELMGDITEPGQQLVVARGGRGGLGNARFKSSTNRAPRQQTNGVPGESRALRLELRLLAHVGLVGLPNAGKSSLVRALSAARPRVADYPFTTLQPILGVVSVDPARSFVITEIPGLIEGAAEGAGLGARFLRQLARNHLLLHLVDLTPPDGSDPVANVRTVEAELARYDPDLWGRRRWLVASKMDRIPESERREWLDLLAEELDWEDAVYGISAQAGIGLERLAQDIMSELEREPEPQ